jgi:hypothetical protein
VPFIALPGSGAQCGDYRRAFTVGLCLFAIAAPAVSRIYPGHLVWARSAIRLALAVFLYLLRPRETHWKPAGKFLKDNYVGVFTVFAGRCRGFCFDTGLQIEIQVELIWNRSQVDCG